MEELKSLLTADKLTESLPSSTLNRILSLLHNTLIAHEEKINELEKLLSTSSKIKAIGEIGLDYYWEKDQEIKEKQTKMLLEQIELANKYNLPVSIHCRDAIQDTFNILKAHKFKEAGIMHCFSGSKEMAKTGESS